MEEIFHPSSKFTLSYYSSCKLKLGETSGGGGSTISCEGAIYSIELESLYPVIGDTENTVIVTVKKGSEIRTHEFQYIDGGDVFGDFWNINFDDWVQLTTSDYVTFSNKVAEHVDVSMQSARLLNPPYPFQPEIADVNPTFKIIDGVMSFCLSPHPLQEISCEGAIDRIMVSSITDGSSLEVYVNDVLVEADGYYMFRVNGIAAALADFDIEVTPYDSLGNEITVEDVPGRYFHVERVSFRNLSSVNKRIRIEPFDANPIDTNYTPENATFDYDLDTRITTFCLSPVV